MHAVLAKVQIAHIDETETNSTENGTLVLSGTYLVQELLPYVLRLTQSIIHCTRWSLLHSMVDHSDSSNKHNAQDFEAFQEILAFSCTRHSLLFNSLSSELIVLLPPHVTSVLQQWNASSVSNLKPFRKISVQIRTLFI